MAIDKGNADCTTGLSKLIYDRWLADSRNGFVPSGQMTDAIRGILRAQSWAVAQSVGEKVDEELGRVFAFYHHDAGGTLAPGGDRRLDFSVKDEDTHNAVTTGANWVFTCPPNRGGLYIVNVSMTVNTNVNATEFNVQLRKGSNLVFMMDTAAQTTAVLSLGGSGLVALAPGDQIHAAVWHNGTGAVSRWARGDMNWIQIARVSQ